MIVELSVDHALIVDANDCRRLHVICPMDLDVDQSLERSGLGRLDEFGQAALIISELRRRAAEVCTNVDWPEEWQAMIDYASAKGWLTADGREVLAHIERL